MGDWEDWTVIGVMTLVAAFGVSAGIYAISARDNDLLMALDGDVAWCQADLAKLKTAKAQVEGRALIAIRDLAEMQRHHSQCRAECAECAPKLAAAELALATLREERRPLVVAPAPAPLVKPPAPVGGRKAGQAAPKRKQAKRAKTKPAPAYWF